VADDLLRLQLAFTLHMADQILGADAEIADEERSWLHERFPPEMLESTGFLDDQGKLTHAYEEARDEALIALPDELPASGKWQIMEDLVNAAAADGLLAAEESDALAHAAALLGVSDQDWSQHLEELFAAGTLKRDGCGE
jgi:uncharacterized tellurite resistance protein B-like protein